MLTFISYLAVFWLGVGIGYFLRQLAAMAACIAFAVLVLSPISAKAECLPSAQAVWQAHGGGWATYRGSAGNRCWMAGHGHNRRHVARPPVPKDRPLQFIARDELRSLLPEKPAAQSPRMSPEAAYAEGLRLMKVYFAEQKAKVAEAK